ncbi:MAG TPA: TPM domain-containing protein [Geminicoccaceae bacterium]|jgi:putative membrane protein|nr:TPM domain-containing protein [Geminicoccaceae bacterium]
MAFLTDQDRQQITAAIVAAERRTSGELVTVIAEAADDYRYIPLLWPALAALMLPAVVLAVWPQTGAFRLYLVQAATFFALSLVAHLPQVHLALVPASVKRRRASRLAREQFFERGLHLTRGRTGVLIFVAVAERHVEIIADAGIHALVPPGTWDQAVAEFVERVRRGRIAEGFITAIGQVGDRLAEHFPRPADDTDELPNRLIEI